MNSALAEEVAAYWKEAMLVGDFESAWTQTDRLEIPRRRRRKKVASSNLLWDGTPFQKRNVVIRCDHGLGDTIQFLRFVPKIRKEAASVHLLAQPALVPLLRRCRGLGTIHDAWLEWRICGEVEMEIMELAYALRATPENLAESVPYLRVGPLPKGTDFSGRKLKAGIVWAASSWDDSRSLPANHLEDILSVPDVEFFSFQQGVDTPRHSNLKDISPLTRSPEAAAACMNRMDVVVSIDGFPAHLAGALGRPVLLMLKNDADWRWMRDRIDTPWYPGMRLFRQERPGDWQSVVEAVTTELHLLGRTLMRSNSQPEKSKPGNRPSLVFPLPTPQPA